MVPTQEELNKLVNEWNVTIPNFRITVEELNAPKAVFFTDALLKILETLDFVSEDVIKFVPRIDNMENLQSFYSILPIMNLCEAINCLFMIMNGDNSTDVTTGKITVYDIIEPTKSKVYHCLHMLFNFCLFICDMKEHIAPKIEQVNDNFQLYQERRLQCDQLKVENDNSVFEIEKIGKQTLQVEKELHKYQDDENKRMEIKELHEKYDDIQSKNESIAADIEKEKYLQSQMIGEINKLNDLVISESDQLDIMTQYEATLKMEKEVDAEAAELQEIAWKKEEDIKTFESMITVLSEYNAMIKRLGECYEQMKEVDKPDGSLIDEENELHVYEEKIKHLKAKQQEKENINDMLTDDINKLNMQENELKIKSSETENILTEQRECESEYIKIQLAINALKSQNLTHYSEYEGLMKKYSKEIPSIYDQMIDRNVCKLKEQLQNLLHASRNKKK